MTRRSARVRGGECRGNRHRTAIIRASSHHSHQKTAPMPSRVVLVHDDPAFLDTLATALRAGGYDTAAFNDSMLAWDAFTAAHKVELLITRIRFPLGSPHGVALALHARDARPGVRVLFMALPELQPYAEGVGMVMLLPVTPAEIVATVAGLLA